MASITNQLRLINESDVVVCSIESITFYDEENEFDEGETFYIHPLTASQCQTVGQCFQGWSEQDKESNNQWDTLREKIENDSELSQKIFNMDSIDYYV